MVAKYGCGALMAKFNVEAAYHNISIHPKDRFLLGLKWGGQFFVDLMLLFGLHSAPFIFHSEASLVEWIIIHNYNVPDLAHYSDDFCFSWSSCFAHLCPVFVYCVGGVQAAGSAAPSQKV